MVTPAAPLSPSTTLWATASKEWVITPKPKPGRKPKKDLAAPTKTDIDAQLDSKGRRVQNRAAQRAFRERKQSQLAELQARVQSYEQGEIERNVALQNIAKRLKEENENLRAENALLREKLGQAPVQDNEKKRWRDESPPSASKRPKSMNDSPRTIHDPVTVTYTPSPPSTVSSPGSSGTSETRYSPLPSYDVQSDPMPTSISTLLDFTSVKPSQIDATGFSSFDCGFCSDDMPCVCRELVAQQAHVANNYGQGNSTAVVHGASAMQLDPSTAPPQACILENLPPYQPPVPLRRRPTSNTKAIFTVTPTSHQTRPANCSGDPSNCLACADDAFGKAFCSAIEETIASQVPCADCPSNQGVHSVSGPSSILANCCGDAANCHCHSPSSFYASSILNSTAEQTKPETMPTNHAWRQLKSHPNVAFADLTLLAEVVARRTKCTGPRVVISPALGSITPERIVTPSTDNQPTEHEPVLLTDPHALYREKERVRSNRPSSSPKLIPQDVLIRCGRERVCEVQTDAVRAAIRLLDAKFT